MIKLIATELGEPHPGRVHNAGYTNEPTARSKCATF